MAPTNDLPNPYARVHPWGELPDPYVPGAYDERASFIGIDEGPDGNIYLLSRCLQNSCTGRSEPALLKLDPSGRLLLSWGSGLFDFPHGLDVDREGNVWVADQRGHQVVKFDADGNHLMTIGERGTAGDPPLVNEPTGVLVAPGGEIFITEGHSFAPGANRVTKYAADGSFLMSWGETGSGPGQFNVPHTIAIDSQGRLFVGDRANNRIQIFDQAGNAARRLVPVRPSQRHRHRRRRPHLRGRLRVLRHRQPGLEEGDPGRAARATGRSSTSSRTLSRRPSSTAAPRGVGVDSAGNVYGGVVRRRMIEKHVPNGEATPLPGDNAPAAPGARRLRLPRRAGGTESWPPPPRPRSAPWCSTPTSRPAT